MIDSSSIRVRQHGANALKRTNDPVAWAEPLKGSDEAQQRWNSGAGRSRGGLTTKIHALADGCGLPIALKLTPGQAHDGRSAADMLDTVRQGQVLLVDRAYDSDALRQSLAARGARANVKPIPNGKRVPTFSAFLYKDRNLVERFFNKLKPFRGVATRYDKLAENYLAGVKLASARI